MEEIEKTNREVDPLFQKWEQLLEEYVPLSVVQCPHRSTVLAARPKSLNKAIQLASVVVPQKNSITHFNKSKRLFNNRGQRNYVNTYNNN